MRKIIKKTIFLFGISFFIFLSFCAIKAQEKVEIYFFWNQGCPHCAQEKPFLEKLKQKYPQVIIKDFEIYYNSENRKLFQQIAQAYNTKPEGVPMTFIGKDFIVGFDKEETTGKEIENLILNCLQNYCPSPQDILKAGSIEKCEKNEKDFCFSILGKEIKIFTNDRMSPKK